MMSKMAAALGKKSDAARYSALYDNIKAAFNRTYVREDGVTVAPYKPVKWSGMPAAEGGPKEGDPIPVDTQTSYALPLRFGLFDGCGESGEEHPGARRQAHHRVHRYPVPQSGPLRQWPR